MGSIEGVIILSPTNEPILTSHFTHPLHNYPLLHTDQLISRIEEAAAAQASNAGSVAAAASSSSRKRAGRAFGVSSLPGELLPISYTEGIPFVSQIADDNDEDGASEDSLSSSDVGRASLDIPYTEPRDGEAATSTTAHASAAALVHIEHNRIRFVATFSRRVDPLLPLTFLHTFVQNLELYLGSPLTEEVLRDNFDVAYQLLEEMLDESGQPLHTEYNTLREIVREPSWISGIVAKVGAVSGLSNAALGNAMSAPQMPSIPWRRPVAPRSARNEAYFDFVETISGVIGRGLSIACQIEGNCKLSGTPDLLLRLTGEKYIVDASLHPCVRLRPWKKERSLSFVPPDGHFVLAELGMQGAPTLERHVPVMINAGRVERSGRDGVAATFKITLSCSRAVDDIDVIFAVAERNSIIETTLSGGTRPGVASEDLNALRGTFHYDARRGSAKWTVPHLSSEQRALELSGTIRSDKPARMSTAVTCRFTVPGLSLTGLKIASIDVANDQHQKPYKGVRSTVKADLDWRW